MVLADVEKLQFIGLDTNFGQMNKHHLQHPMVVQQDEHARLAMRFAVHILKARASSMAWHSHGWPGQLVLFASSVPEDRANAWERLHQSFLADLSLKAESTGSAVLRKLMARSPFRSTLMAEVVHVAFSPDSCHSQADRENELRALAVNAFSSFGQTKIVEDSLCQLRDRADRDTKNKNLRSGQAVVDRVAIRNFGSSWPI